MLDEAKRFDALDRASGFSKVNTPKMIALGKTFDEEQLKYEFYQLQAHYASLDEAGRTAEVQRYLEQRFLAPYQEGYGRDDAQSFLAWFEENFGPIGEVNYGG